MGTTPAILRTFGAAATLGLAAGAAHAQRGDLPDTRPSLEQMLDRLDDRFFGIRERATVELAERKDLSLEQAERLARDPALSPEQRLRMERVAFGVFLRGPRAAMGIRFAGTPDEEPTVGEPQPGFDAAEVLRPNDRFVEGDGLPIPDQATLRAMILSHEPGEIMSLKLLRAGQTVETQLTLGSFASLQNPGGPQPADLLQAWSIRQAREAAPGAAMEPIVPEPVATGAEIPEAGTPEWRQTFASGDSPESVVIGGQARRSAELSLAELAASQAARRRVADAARGGQGDILGQIAWFRSQRDLRLAELASLQVMLAQEGLGPDNRQAMLRELQSQRALLESLEGQIRALEAAVRNGQMRP